MLTIDVVAGVIVDSAGQLLLSQRSKPAELAGLWEFPGGKIEPGESRYQALVRELHEELGIEVLESTPFKCFTHDQDDKRIVLDMWFVHRWVGNPAGREGQAVSWFSPERVSELPVPAADIPVVQAWLCKVRAQASGALQPERLV